VLLTIATIAVLGFMGVRLVGAARFSVQGLGRDRVVLVLRGLRWRHIWPVPFVLTAVLVVALALVQLPLLSFGWWTAIGGLGNPVTGTTEQTAGTPLEWLIPLFFALLLLPALPLFAWREEELFRLGAETWSWPKRVAKAVLFGLVHALIGIPIGVALALSIGGGYFQACYLRGWRETHDRRAAVVESTRAHTAYNLAIVSLLLVAIVLTIAGVG
jgi:hypothetical protein